MANDNGRLWAWRIAQAVAGVVLCALSLTTPLVVSAVTKMTDATTTLTERVIKIESTRFTKADGMRLTREIDAKADLDYCAKQWATVSDKLNAIHRAVVRLEAFQSKAR